VRAAAIRRLSEELALTLGTPEVTVRRAPEGLGIEFPRRDPHPVRFLETLAAAKPLPEATALLGLSEEGVPLLTKLSSPDVAHVLIAGTTGSGKSVLLRTIVASLVLSHSPDSLRVVCLDPKDRAFRLLVGMPHLLRPPLSKQGEISEVLRSLERLMEVRDKHREAHPRVVVLIDELADIIMTVDAADKPLTRLAQRGREAGIHLVAATQRPSAAILSGLMRANFPLRLVGRVVSAADARIAAGRYGTGAETLTGRGDFLAVYGGQIRRFQAAYAEGREMETLLADRRTGPTAEDLLPGVETEERADSSGRDIADLARRLAPWWAENGNEYGCKSGACRYLFGDDVRYAGYYAGLTDRVIKALESTTTSSSQASLVEPDADVKERVDLR
jgi:S-DNA-T family DNA segregation ATPase FtsK/SpoIIIE